MGEELGKQASFGVDSRVTGVFHEEVSEWHARAVYLTENSEDLVACLVCAPYLCPD